MAAPPFIAARVTPEMKSLLRVLAEREQKTESAVVRQLLEVVVGFGGFANWRQGAISRDSAACEEGGCRRFRELARHPGGFVNRPAGCRPIGTVTESRENQSFGGGIVGGFLY